MDSDGTLMEGGWGRGPLMDSDGTLMEGGWGGGPLMGSDGTLMEGKGWMKKAQWGRCWAVRISGYKRVSAV